MPDAAPEKSLDPELARHLHRALTTGREELFALLQDRRPEVLRAALKNRHLSEDHLLALLRRRDLTEDLLKAVARLEQLDDSHRLKVALACNPAVPGTLVRTLLPHLHLFELVNLCFRPGVTPDQKLAAERVILQRLPQVEPGNKMTLARRATSTVVGAILREGDSRLMEACLNNVRLKEVALLQFLHSGRATAETISAIARHPKWKNRPNLRLAILKNRKTPAVWFTLFLPRLATAEIHNLLASRRLGPHQKQLARDELKKRGHG